MLTHQDLLLVDPSTRATRVAEGRVRVTAQFWKGAGSRPNGLAELQRDNDEQCRAYCRCSDGEKRESNQGLLLRGDGKES